MDAAGFGLRFGYTSGGCSGNKYIIEFESEPDEDDLIFEFDGGVHVYVKESQMDKLKKLVRTMVEKMQRLFKPTILTLKK